MIKKYNNKKNVAGIYIKKVMKEKGIKKKDLCQKLELCGISINPDELLLMEKDNLMIKDFELIAICKILEIDINKLKEYIAN